MIEVSDVDFMNLTDKRFIVAEFGAEWCGACKKLMPVLEELEKEYEDVCFVHFNFEMGEGQEVFKKFRVNGLPTIIMFKDGKNFKRFSGLYPKAKIVKMIEAMLAEE